MAHIYGLPFPYLIYNSVLIHLLLINDNVITLSHGLCCEIPHPTLKLGIVSIPEKNIFS